MGESLGGVQTSVWRLVNWLGERRIHFVLFFPRFRGLIGRLSSTERLPILSPQVTTSAEISTLWDRLPHVEVLYFLWSIAAALQIHATNRKNRFSAIHAFGYRFDGLAALIASRLLRVPYSVHIKGPGLLLRQILPNTTQRLLRSLEVPLNLLVLDKASLILCESEEGRRSIRPYVSRLEKIQLSPPPIRTKDYKFSKKVRASVRQKLGIQGNAVVVGYVGRLSPEKNVAALVHAISKALPLVRCPLRLMIIGSGPSEPQLKHLARSSCLEEKISFLGRRHDVPELLQGIDIFVLPSFFEGYSNSLIEAMTAGRAIVASDIHGNREVLGKDGFFFDPNNVKELTNILVRFANNPRLRSRKGLAACDLARKFDLDSVCDDFVEKITNMT